MRNRVTKTIVFTILAVGFTACTFDDSALQPSLTQHPGPDAILIEGDNGYSDAYQPDLGWYEEDAGGTWPDTTMDAGHDAHTDIGRDTYDVGTDIADVADAGNAPDVVDVMEDTAPDVETDTADVADVADTTDAGDTADVADAIEDTMPDDTTEDASPDVVEDTSEDIVEDVLEDVEPDVPVVTAITIETKGGWFFDGCAGPQLPSGVPDCEWVDFAPSFQSVTYDPALGEVALIVPRDSTGGYHWDELDCETGEFTLGVSLSSIFKEPSIVNERCIGFCHLGGSQLLCE